MTPCPQVSHSNRNGRLDRVASGRLRGRRHSSSSSTTAAGTPSGIATTVCADITSLQSAANDLKQLDVSTASVNDLKQAILNIAVSASPSTRVRRKRRARPRRISRPPRTSSSPSCRPPWISRCRSEWSRSGRRSASLRARSARQRPSSTATSELAAPSLLDRRPGRHSQPSLGELQGSATFAARRSARPSAGTRSCSSVSRSRRVTVPSSIVWPSTVTPHGVPISSWRR